MPRLPLLLALAAALPALAQDPAAAPGIERAASSRLEWGTRDSVHPVLGTIRFAYLKGLVETAVGDRTVYSRVFFSCQRDVRKFAIELANAASPADLVGLHAAAEPRLVCHRPVAGAQPSLAQEPLLVTWEVNEKLGDVLARGLRAFPLRECASIGVVQEVRLPEGWAQASARVELELLPYDRTIDSIFVACGERSAYAPAPAAPPPVAPAAAASPDLLPARAAQAPWRSARVVSSGKTNVRAGPGVDSAIVTQLAPGAVVRVQRTDTDWWRAKPAKGAAFEGYIREDRLVFR